MDAEHESDEDQDGAPPGVPVLRRDRLGEALCTSLDALQPEDRDQALAALLAMYAQELDGAAAVAARARRLAQDVEREHGRESALYEQVQALQAALSRRQALDKIGARFHGGLVEMLGTPRARAAGKSGASPAAGGQGGGGSPLAKLRLASGGDE